MRVSAKVSVKKDIVLPLLLAVSFLSAFAAAAWPITDKELKSRLITILDVTAYESYSSTDSGSDLWGFNATGYFSPTIKLSDKSYIIPLYQGGYLKQYQVVTEDEGNRRYSENQYHNGSISYFQKLTNHLSLKATGLGRIQFNNETRDEKWGKGLYDYRDFGGAVDMNYRFPQAKEMIGEFFAGGEYYMRVYPNYHSLISLIAATAPETNEKDYNGYQTIAGYRVTTPVYTAELKYSFLIKYYLDKRVITELGTLDTGRKREDYVHIGNMALSMNIDKNLSLILNANTTYNISNQNYYDTRGTTTNLSDDVFTYRYYNYYSFGGGPGVMFRFPIERIKNECTAFCGYDYAWRKYTHRKAQELDGAYQSELEVDTFHTIRASLKYPLNKNLSVISFGDYTFALSNMQYNRYYKYNYDLYKISCGLNLKY